MTKRFIILFFYIATFFLPLNSFALEQIRPVVVELYTSQGCSSCPIADKVLAGIAQSYPDEILSLSFHVDYWDHIGWKDPHSNPAFSQRQRNYAKKMERGGVYTPQMIIDGYFQVVGSNKSRVFEYIKIVAEKQIDLGIKLAKKTGHLRVQLPANEAIRDSEVLLIGFDSKHTTKILRGENEGKTIDNYNVVKSLENLGRWKGQELVLLANIPDSERIAVIVQAPDFGPILSATML